ncbi:MAG: VWA domain-containing protein [Candidatus Buchananbacteria bacterium]|jgi:cysteine-rich repeat protein
MLQKNKKLILTSLLLIAAFLFLPAIVFAAGEVPSLGLFGGIFGEATLAQIIIRLIQFFLTVLGFIALVIMLYAGFTWMTAAGDPAKVDKAKKMIQQVVIGLIIIFSAFAITAFIYDRFGPPVGPPNGCVGPECPPPPSCVGPGCTPYWTNYPPEIAYINPALDVLSNTDQRTLAATSTSDDISNGAPGNYVSIVGRYFGNVPGKIFFVSRSDGSRIQAQLAPCARSWSSNLIIALVPAGLTLSGASHEADVATQDPLRNYDVIIEKLASDSSTLTSNIWGFQVNSIERPGICSMVPNHGVYPATTTLTGFKFPIVTPRNIVWSISPNFTSSTGSNWSSSTVVDVVPQDLAGRSLVSIFNGESYSNSFLFMISNGRAGSPCGYDTQSCREDITTCDAETDLACQFCSTDPTKPNYQENCNISRNCTCQPIVDESCEYNASSTLNSYRNCTVGGCLGQEACSNKSVWSKSCELPAGSTCVPFLGNSSNIAAFSWAFSALKNPAPGMSCKSEIWNDDTCDVNGCIDTNLACDPLATADHPACTCVPKDQLCTVGKIDTTTCPALGACKQVKACQDSGHWGECAVTPGCIPYPLVPASTIASYSWSFGANNGNGDVGPMVETSCDGSIDCSKNRLPSPSPWSDEWNAANHPELGIQNDKACLNAEIYARFTAAMSSATISSSTIRLYVSSTSGWIDQTNAKVEEVEPLLSEGEGDNADSFAIKLKPGIDLDPNSIYRVFLSNQIRDVVGRNLIDNPSGARNSLCAVGGSSPTAAAGVCWSFITRPSGPDAICQIGCVNCGPNKYFNRYYGQEKEHKVTPVSLDNACISLNNRDYAWDWSQEQQNLGGAVTNGWFLQKFFSATYSWLTNPFAADTIGIASQPANTVTTGYGTTTAYQESRWKTNADYKSWFGADDIDYFRIKGQVKATGNVGVCAVHNNFTDPIVIENQYCSKTSSSTNPQLNKQILQSPSPWKGQTDACTNAAIFALFSRNMFNSSLLELSSPLIDGRYAVKIGNFEIYKCSNGAAATSSNFASRATNCTLLNKTVSDKWTANVFNYNHKDITLAELTAMSASQLGSSTPEGIAIYPPTGTALDKDSWYKIAIKGGESGVRGADSTLNESPEGVLQVPSKNAQLDSGAGYWYYWYFKTGLGECPIDQVAVLPQIKFMPKIGETQQYLADPYAANCNHLNPYRYKWKWDSLVNPFSDRCSAANPTSGDYIATICESGASCNPANEPDLSVFGKAAVKAFGQNEGNTKITAAAVQGECKDYKWGAGELQVGFGGFKVSEHSNSNCLNTDLLINFTQDAKSTSLYSNVKLYQCDDAACQTVSESNLKSIDINSPQGLPGNPNPLFTNQVYFTPRSSDLLEPGKTYRVVIKGGQSGVVSAYNTNLLNLNYSLVPNSGGEACDPSLYPWRPGDHQAGLCSATCTLTGNLCGTTSAQCNPATDPLCDATCHKAGNSNTIASCGNSKIEATENCDDGNTKNGDGCSSHCLLEGSNSAYGSLCGNGKVERGEACDDGNISNGDSCSSKCLLEAVDNNVLTNVDFENGTVGSAPLNWSVASQSHSSVAISDTYARSGTKSVKITQDANQPYPGICNQVICADFPAWLKCTWLPATSQCQFDQPDNAHPMTPKPIYNSGQTFIWGNTHRVMWGSLYYDVSNLGFRIGQKYIVKFNYKGEIDPQSRVDAQFSFNPGWIAQCNQKQAPNIKPDGSCLYGSDCSDQPGYCCVQAPVQTKCYTGVNLPTLSSGNFGVGSWKEYRTEFTYTSELAQLFNSAGKLTNTISLSIPYANITNGTTLYIDDFSVERVGSDPNAPICGNSKIEAGEECDSGSANGPANRCGSNCLLNGAPAAAAGGTCGNKKLENGQFDSYSWTFVLTDKAQVCQAVNFELNPCPNGVWSISADSNVSDLSLKFYKGSKSDTGSCISDAQMNNLSFWRRIFNQFVRIIKSFLGFRSVIAADWWCPINDYADGAFDAAALSSMRLGNYKRDITIDGAAQNTEVIAYTDDSDNYKINFIRSSNWDTNTEYKAVAIFDRKGVAGTSTASVTTFSQSCKMKSVKFDVWPRGLAKSADGFFCASDPLTGKPDDCGRSSEDLYDDDMSAPWTMNKADNGYNLDSDGMAQAAIGNNYKGGNQHLYRVWPLDSNRYVLRGNNFLASLSNIGAAKTTLSEIGSTDYKGDFWTTPGFNPGRSFFDVDISDSDPSANNAFGTLPIFTYFCNNPWPDAKNFPFIDSSDNCKAGSGSCINTNFGTYYCRDAGKADSTADDLPSIANYDASTKTFGAGTGVVMGLAGNNKLKEFLFAGRQATGRDGAAVFIAGSSTSDISPAITNDTEGSLTSSWGANDGQVKDFVYHLNVATLGKFNITLETSNDANADIFDLGFNSNYGTCVQGTDLIGNKLYQNLLISVDGVGTSTIKALASAPENHQFNRLVQPLILSVGQHTITIRFLNDCICDAVYGQSCASGRLDSNLKIYGILLNNADPTGATDAIGLRMYNNNNHYSPELWYKSLFNPGLQGNLEKLSVDGYSAAQEGRTVYVNAADFNGGQSIVYSDIYLMSYNQGASKATENIYGQMISNWFFNAGSKADGGLEYGAALGYCSQGTETEDNKCFTDLDCVKRNAGFCRSEKAKITRDTQRLSDVQDIYNSMSGYHDKLRCSNDFSRACSNNAGCFGGGTCGHFYPNLRAGTYITGKTYSAWPSWQDNLAKEFGVKLPVDPINKFWVWDGTKSINCSNPYNSVTCWDETSRRMECNLDYNSAVYAYYGTKSGTSTRVYAKGEYNYGTGELDPFKAVWSPAWQDVVNLNYDIFGGYNSLIRGGQFCVAASDTCGDGSCNNSETCSTCPIDCGCSGKKSCNQNAGTWICSIKQAPVAAAKNCGNGTFSDSGEDCDFINGVPLVGMNGLNPIYVTSTVNGQLACTDQCKFPPWFNDVKVYYRDNDYKSCGDGLRTDQEECDCGTIDGVFGIGNQKYNPFICNSLNSSFDSSASIYVSDPSELRDFTFCDTTCQRHDKGNYSYCGDSHWADPAVVTGSGEQCDLGFNNGKAGSGCLADCKCDLADGYACSGGVPSKCGNGTPDSGEACDLGLGINGTNGCTTSCACAATYVCPGGVPTKCGNAVVDAGEACDLGLGINGTNGCTTSCACKAGYDCTGGIPQLMCGNGHSDPGENCDLGNPAVIPGGQNGVTGSGCSSICDFTCTAAGPLSEQNIILSKTNFTVTGQTANFSTPNCRLAKDIESDITISGNVGSTEIVFVTDVSASMDIASLKIAITAAIARIFDELPSAKIGLVHFSDVAANDVEAAVCPRSLCDDSQEAYLDSRINLYAGSGGTNPASGLQVASNLFNGSTAQNKIIIFMSDGSPTSNSDDSIVENVTTWANANKSASIAIYSAALTIDSNLKGAMNYWSSNNGAGNSPNSAPSTKCSGFVGPLGGCNFGYWMLDDVYSADGCNGNNYCFSNTDLGSLFTSIISRVLTNLPQSGIQIRVDGTNTSFNNVLPNPDGSPKTYNAKSINLPAVVCSGGSHTMQIDYVGDGSVSLANTKIYYCPDFTHFLAQSNADSQFAGPKNKANSRVAGAFEKTTNAAGSLWQEILSIFWQLLPGNIIKSFVK